ncbi:MAG: hypothetical protein F4X17_07225 [Gemmatimonadetes bacterium]|nr:hypothetical protein [Gemmatimonadota bacterium]
MDSLYAGYDIIDRCNFDAFHAILRVVFESFPKLFYCMANKEKAKHVFCCEEFFYSSDAKRTDEGVESYCGCVNGINDEKCKYVRKPWWFREKVYTNARRDELNELYAVYSTASHPNIITFNDTMTPDEVEHGRTTSLDIITSYSLMNLFIMVNVVEKELKQCSEFDDSKLFVEDQMKKIGGRLGKSILRLYPDKTVFISGLPFALPDY